MVPVCPELLTAAHPLPTLQTDTVNQFNFAAIKFRVLAIFW